MLVAIWEKRILWYTLKNLNINITSWHVASSVLNVFILNLTSQFLLDDTFHEMLFSYVETFKGIF